ncbi:MAG: SLC13 family permease [Chloroflexota bacterium]
MKTKSLVGPFLGIVALLVFMVLPPAPPLTQAGMRAAGVMVFTLIWWITVGVGFPSLLALALLVLTGAMTAKAVFAASLGSYITTFMIAIYGISICLRQTGFSRRFALWFISRPFAKGHPWAMISMFWLSCLMLGSVMSGSATCITFMGIAEPLLEELGYRKGERFAAMLMVGISWVATAAFITTPIGHGSNILLMEWIKRDAGIILTFPKWMMAGIPVGLLIYLVILGYMRFIVRPDMSRFTESADKWISEAKDKLGPMKLEEKIVVGTFVSVLILWLLPGFIGGVLPAVAEYLTRIGLAVPPLVGACFLCFIHVKDKPLLTVRQWMHSVPWDSVLLIAAIFAMQDIMARPELGITEYMAMIFKPLAVSLPFFIYRVIGQFWVVTQTNLMSNLVSAMVVYNAMVPAAAAAGIGNLGGLGFTIWCGARAGFALPSATTNTAMVTGSGWVPIGFMAKHGAIVSVIVVFLTVFIVYPWASLIIR